MKIIDAAFDWMLKWGPWIGAVWFGVMIILWIIKAIKYGVDNPFK